MAFSATCVHLPFRRAVVFGINKRGGRFVPTRCDAWSNLQAVDGRSRIRSGEATMTNADSNPSHQIPTLPFKNRQPLSEFTRYPERTWYKRAEMGSVLDGWRLIYCWMIDSTGLAVVIGSAWRCSTFQVPSSGRKIIVTRRADGETSCLPPTLALLRSIHTV